jgi:hypothetical protein
MLTEALRQADANALYSLPKETRSHQRPSRLEEAEEEAGVGVAEDEVVVGMFD